jgi:hypothetical protein
MSKPVILSVDGLSGLDGATNRDAHIVTPDAAQQNAAVSFERHRWIVLVS